MRSSLAVLAAAFLAAASCGTGGDRSPVSVEDFVLVVHTEGVSYAAAAEYSGEDDLRTLHRLLGEERHAAYWPNITTVIGIVGGAADAAKLSDFVEGVEAPFDSSSTAVFRGRASAVSSLGHLACKGIPGVSDYLQAGIEPGAWHGRAPWLEQHDHPDWAAKILSDSAVKALAFLAFSDCR